MNDIELADCKTQASSQLKGRIARGTTFILPAVKQTSCFRITVHPYHAHCSHGQLQDHLHSVTFIQTSTSCLILFHDGTELLFPSLPLPVYYNGLIPLWKAVIFTINFFFLSV